MWKKKKIVLKFKGIWVISIDVYLFNDDTFFELKSIFEYNELYLFFT